MKITTLACSVIVALALTACSDSEHEVNKNRPISNVPSTPSPAMESMAGAEDAVEEVTEAVTETVDATEETMEKAEEVVAETESADVMEKAEEMLKEEGLMDKAEEMVADADSEGLMEKAEEMVADADSGDLMEKAEEMVADADSNGLMDKAEEMVADAGGSDLAEQAGSLLGGADVEEAIEEVADATAGGASLATVSMEDGTALAKKSGCFACHAIDRKILGPAWQDVSARYADDQAAGKAHLLNKVAKGGSGVWADQGITAGMPPYSPRVSDENIEVLVDFILGL